MGEFMKVNVKGKSDTLSKKEVITAINFYASLLMRKAFADKLTINVRYENKKVMGGYQGFIEFLDDNHRPKEFLISLKKDLPKRKQLITIAHELVHVKQYAKGELKYLFKGGQDKWQGKIIPRKTHYFDKPWEIEAFGRELGLYERYIEYKKENKLKF